MVMNRYAFRHRSCRLLLFVFVVLALAGCAKEPLVTLPGVSGSGRAGWNRMREFRYLKASAILAWEDGRGRKGRNRIRLFLAPPDRLKIQWLTPWGSVAGQVLLAGDYFWLSDARRQETWHGTIDSLVDCFPGLSDIAWLDSTRFLTLWPLLFSTAERDKDLTSASVAYAEEGAGKSLVKVLSFADGSRVEIRASVLEEVDSGGIFARQYELGARGSKISLTLRKYGFPEQLDAKLFTYSLKNFSMHECLDGGRSERWKRIKTATMY
ncbi:MAG: hypothetical protein GXO34_06155 [Deltaproteobacteria bacterium]|nr:hypothetical protein [Deltaproteobacteria bacterium]